MKNKKDLTNSLSLLASFLKSYEDGNVLMYLPMAVELRKLVCEDLMSSVVPSIKLHKIHMAALFEKTPSLLVGLVSMMPGEVSVLSSGAVSLSLRFSRGRELMTVTEWTKQPFFSGNITLNELIKSVADKEAAHSDPDYNKTLQHCRSWSFVDVNCHILGIYGISKYIHALFMNEYQAFL